MPKGIPGKHIKKITNPDAEYQDRVLELKWYGRGVAEISKILNIDVDRVGKILNRCYARCAGYDYDVNLERYVAVDRINKEIGGTYDDMKRLRRLANKYDPERQRSPELEDTADVGSFLAVYDRLDKTKGTLLKQFERQSALLGLDTPVRKEEGPSQPSQIHVSFTHQPINQSPEKASVIVDVQCQPEEPQKETPRLQLLTSSTELESQ